MPDEELHRDGRKTRDNRASDTAHPKAPAVDPVEDFEIPLPSALPRYYMEERGEVSALPSARPSRREYPPCESAAPPAKVGAPGRYLNYIRAFLFFALLAVAAYLTYRLIF
jgi:hypothetical protein